MTEQYGGSKWMWLLYDGSEYLDSVVQWNMPWDGMDDLVEKLSNDAGVYSWRLNGSLFKKSQDDNGRFSAKLIFMH